MQPRRAPRLLHHPHHIARQAFPQQSLVEPEIERGDGLARRQRLQSLARGIVVFPGFESQIELVLFQMQALRSEFFSGHAHIAVCVLLPAALLCGLNDLLSHLAEPRPQRAGVHLQAQRGDARAVRFEPHFLHIHFVADQFHKGPQPFRARTGDGEGAQRLTDAHILAPPQREGRRADFAHLVHVGDQLRIGGQPILLRIGPVAEMHAFSPAQALVNLVGEKGQQRACGPAQRLEGAPQCVVGGLLVQVFGAARNARPPEARAASADEPVVEGVQMRRHGLAGAGQVVAIHALRHFLHQRAGFGEDVAVENGVAPGFCSRGLCAAPKPRAHAIGVGVEAEEVPGAPQRIQHAAHHIGDGLAVLRHGQIAAAQNGRAHQIPAQRIGAVGAEHLLRLGIVAQAL